MNIIFLTLANINSIDDRGIYTDLLRTFVHKGHHVSIVTPKERRNGIETFLEKGENYNILHVKTLNIVSTNIIEKGIGTLAIEYQYMWAIRKHLSGIKYDLILYSTPPITFTRVIKAIKRRDHAKTYLLLKDIFPQNAVDLGMFKREGILHRFFRRKEKQLYAVSDYIGCMSPANVAYVLKHNPQIRTDKVEVCPNSIEPDESIKEKEDTFEVRKKYNIPQNAVIFIFGGNMGKPQGLSFLTEVLEANNNKADRYFIVIGTGTERQKVADWFATHEHTNSVLLDGLPKREYDQLVKACDVGLIFLDQRFTIPNYPSRLLSYLEYKMPVIVASDNNSDMGKIAEENKYGFFAVHGDTEMFNDQLDKLTKNRNLIKEMGENGYAFMMKNYTVERSYDIIMKKYNTAPSP
ncbi:MAG: glycosyltransferase family 4 protein [Paludibacter sp.]|nr:glycosyltransferase family 4 protein [Paludibacter sp.]